MKVHYSSNNQSWTTPINLFNRLKHEYNLKIDVASSDENKLLDKYFTEEDSGLDNDWLENSFCNPPYNNLRKWIEKAHSETQKNDITVVMLIPARTDTIAWHDVIFRNKYDVIFIKGRLKFGNQPNPAPFPSAIVIMKKGSKSEYKTLDSKEL